MNINETISNVGWAFATICFFIMIGYIAYVCNIRWTKTEQESLQLQKLCVTKGGTVIMTHQDRFNCIMAAQREEK